MKSMFNYIAPNSPMPDSGNARFFDNLAERLHDRTVYDILKKNVRDMHPTLITSLLETLDDHDLELIEQCTDWFEIKVLKGRMLDGRRARAKVKKSSHRLNYPIEEVLDDYVNRRPGKLVEAKRQLRKRFDGLDHPMQERVMMAFMEKGNPSEREFICDKLYGDDFWTDDYIPLVERWWEQYQDYKMARVVVQRCPREYILTHLDELKGRYNCATLCLRTGILPPPTLMKPWTYLYVMKTLGGGQKGFREGEMTVLLWVREYLYEEGSENPIDSIYDIPYVRRMLLYLGEMGMVEDIMAVDAFNRRLRGLPPTKWMNTAIKEIEDAFPTKEYVFKKIK